MCEQSIVGNYYRLEPKQRMEYIVCNYECFPGVIQDYETELEDWIRRCRTIARQESLGDLGVRIQSGRSGSSPTEGIVNENMSVETIMKTYTLDKVCSDLDDAEEIERGLLELKLMRREFKRFKKRVGVLNKQEREMLFTYYSKTKRVAEFSEELAITDKAVRERVYKIKRKLLTGFVERFELYSDDTILSVRFLEEE